MTDIEKSDAGDDPEVNAQRIMGRIRDRIRRLHPPAEAEALDPDRPQSGGAFTADAADLEIDLSHDLEQMRITVDSPWVSVAQRERPLPFRSFIFRVEHLLHRLIVKYVNMLAARQIAFNRSALQCATALIHMERNSAAQLGALRRDLTELRERLATIERARRD